jgi:outer membrane protein OmpA-like peptidoglycan-associated protein
MQDYNDCCNTSRTGDGDIGLVNDQKTGNKSTSSIGTDDESGLIDSKDGKGKISGSATIDPSRWKGPLTFNWSSTKPLRGDAWNTYRDSILAALPDDQLLQITGLYRTGEASVSGFDNLGLARANEIREEFKTIPDDRIRFYSRSVPVVEGDKKNPFNALSFRSLINTEKIKEIEDKTIIYFPYNSTKKLNDKEVEVYLDDVAERLKRTNEKVNLVGHTDSLGDPQSNLRMGQWRTDVIANYLISKGVSKNQIVTISRGESDPAATNQTAEGRAKNRRTELRIIK